MSAKVKRITQLTHGFTIGDAVSDTVRLIHESAVRLGYDSKIFALSIHENLQHMAQEASSELPPTDVLLLHYSIGGRVLDVFFRSKARLKGFLFHNVTPPEYFEGINRRVFDNTSDGLRSIRDVVEASSFIISVSEFNLHTLHKFADVSVKKHFVLPLAVPEWKITRSSFLDKLNWYCVPKQLRSKKAKILYVGRVAPNKNLEAVIRVFREFKFGFEGDSVLWVVGSEVDCEIYRAKLETLAFTYGVLDSVAFWGHVSDGLLRLFYQNADCFFTASKHEGFCVPVIEAFKFNLPVVAENSPGISETVGSSGLLVNTDDAVDTARQIHKAIFDHLFRTELIRKQAERYLYFNMENFRYRLGEILRSINDLL